jgi:hypothetical protein
MACTEGSHGVFDGDGGSDTQLRRLEAECPGITQVERDEDGGILLSLEDDELRLN